MASIAEWIEKIKTAIYGEEVRGAIWQSLDAMNTQVDAINVDSAQIEQNKTDIATNTAAITALNSSLNLNYTSSADNIASAIRGWIDVAVAKGKSGFYSGNLTWSGHFSGVVVANVHVVSPARVTFLYVPQVGNNSGKHLTATLDGSNFQVYEFEGSRIL